MQYNRDDTIGYSTDVQGITAQARGQSWANPQPVSVWSACKGSSLMVVAFLLALMMPTYTSFDLGPVRLTLYRLLLILTFIPNLFRLLSNEPKLNPADILLFLGILWAAITLLYHQGFSDGLESGGIFVVETLGPYMLARCAIRTRRDFVSFVALLLVLTWVLLPATAIEALVNRNLFGQGVSGMDMRMGLHRARGPFDHPIVFGVFVSSVFGMSWFCFPQEEKPVGFHRVLRSGTIVAATITSVSSGALVAMIVQLILVAWNNLFSGVRFRWRLFMGLIAIMYVAVDLLSNRTPMRVFLTYMTFSAHTAYNRLIIWDWGFNHNVLVNPVMGIGLNDWIRPSWMHSSSMDNFWLVLMVRHGVPCFILIAAAGFYLLFVGGKRAGRAGLGSLQKGWVVTMIGVIIAGCTVHYWNALLSYFFFLMGVGAWYCDSAERGVSSN